MSGFDVGARALKPELLLGAGLLGRDVGWVGGVGGFARARRKSAFVVRVAIRIGPAEVAHRVRSFDFIVVGDFRDFWWFAQKGRGVIGCT